MVDSGCSDQAGCERFPALKKLLGPRPRDVWDDSWWGTVSAGPAAWLTPSWLSMLGFELSLPRCGGVWAAQCLNSLMTARGHCPALPGPRHIPGRKRWGWSCGAAAKNPLPCPWTKRDINGVLQNGMTAGQG